MAQEYWVISFVVGALMGFQIMTTLFESTLLAGIGAFIFACVVTAGWLYSPAPNRSVFVLDGEPTGDPKAGFWGFKRGGDDA